MPRAKSSLRTGPASFSSVFTAAPDRIERRKPLASLHQQEMDFFWRLKLCTCFAGSFPSPRKTDRLPSRFMPPPPCRGEPRRTRGFVPAAPPLPDAACCLCSWTMERAHSPVTRLTSPFSGGDAGRFSEVKHGCLFGEGAGWALCPCDGRLPRGWDV